MTQVLNPVKNNDHSEFPPSKMQLFYECPGAWYLSKDIPQRQSEDAAEGTMLHAVMAKKALEPAMDINNLTNEQQDAINFCVKILNERLDGVKIATEQRVNVKDDSGQVITWGTADVVAISDNKGFIVDWKFGRGEVEDAEDNLQKATYALALMTEYNVSEVETVIVQPRLHHVSSYIFRDKDALYNTITAIINRCKDNKSVICNVGTHCTYCDAKINCHAFRRAQDAIENLEDKQVKFNDNELTELYRQNHLVAALTKKNMDWIKPELSRILKENGDKFYGITRSTKTIRAIEGITAAWECLADELDKDEFLGCCDVSITKVEDKIRDKKELSKDKAKKYLEEKLGDILKKTESETIKVNKL